MFKISKETYQKWEKKFDSYFLSRTLDGKDSKPNQHKGIIKNHSAKYYWTSLLVLNDTPYETIEYRVDTQNNITYFAEGK